MKKVLIIGGGFAGLNAARRLCEFRGPLEAALIDKKPTSDFLPLLPDCIGRGINPEFLSYDIGCLAGALGFDFIDGEVTGVDWPAKEVITKERRLKYDYLIIASGSETNFYGNRDIKQHVFTLDDAGDAARVIEALRRNEFDNCVVCGGGYTGIEAAVNLRVYFNKSGRRSRIFIVERSPGILGALPVWIKEYVSDNLKRLNIEVLVNNTVDRIEGAKVYLGQGGFLDNALAIWAAGVKTAPFIQNLDFEKNPQGRLKVDECLRLNADCFVAGDAALFLFQNNYLRMGVHFAIFQGKSAAENVIRLIKGGRPEKYMPRDFGYVVPFADNRSCGVLLGLKIKGFMATLAHFIMCVCGSYGLKNKIGIIKGLVLSVGCRRGLKGRI